MVLVLPCLVFTQQSLDIGMGTTNKIENWVNSFFANGLFTGTVLVTCGDPGIRHRKVIYEGAYGYAIKEWKIKNQMDTKMLIGSNSKQFTALLVLQEVERGDISLDGTISDYLPSYRTDTGSQVTIHQLLSMQSRIPNYTTLSDFMYLPGYSDVNIPPVWSNSAFRLFFPEQVFIEKYCSLDLAAPPNPACANSTYEYSSSNYYILGAILEYVTGKSYATLLQERIFEPLGMNNSGYNLETDIIPKRAIGYHFNTLTGSLTRGKVTDMSTAYAAGAIYSTAEDLNKWNASLYTDQLLSDEYRQKMFELHAPLCPNIGEVIGIQLYYGYGFMIGYIPMGPGQQVTMVVHGGQVYETFESFMMRLLENKYTIIVLSNTAVTLPPGYPDIPAQISLGIFQILYGVNPLPNSTLSNIDQLPYHYSN